MTGTYFPQQDDYTTISFENFQDVGPGDTLEIAIGSVYIGCKIQMGTEVITQWTDSTRYWKDFLLEQDSIRQKSNATVQFHWRDDMTAATNNAAKRLKKAGRLYGS
ncbi:MAG: hypothetical protein U5J63_00050 [Fodinibius sp.]|nr:hypothetical protein [Fodinibius sp.]